MFFSMLEVFLLHTFNLNLYAFKKAHSEVKHRVVGLALLKYAKLPTQHFQATKFQAPLLTSGWLAGMHVGRQEKNVHPHRHIFSAIYYMPLYVSLTG